MPYKYLLHEEAHVEVADAYEWYETKQTGLGDRFLESVETSLTKISHNPEFYTKVYRNFRQLKVARFPFTIVFEFYPKKSLIHIAAIHHIKRSTKSKFRKIK